MFRSSQNLRLAAEMRALERVARPWRESRTTWFDGTPESVEARLAATERVLTHAKAGVTPAHMALEREAAAARAELRGASHRLLTDFLDDGARAFKGSKRVAEGLVDDLYGADAAVDEFGLPVNLDGGGPSLGEMFDSAMKSGSRLAARVFRGSKRVTATYCPRCDWEDADSDSAYCPDCGFGTERFDEEPEPVRVTEDPNWKTRRRTHQPRRASRRTAGDGYEDVEDYYARNGWNKTPDYHIEQWLKGKGKRYVLVQENEWGEPHEPAWTWAHYDDGNPIGNANYPNADGAVRTREEAIKAAEQALAQPDSHGMWSNMRQYGWDPQDQGDPLTYRGEPEFANRDHPNYQEYLRRRQGGRRPFESARRQAGMDWRYKGYNEDDGKSGHETTTELGDSLQTHPEFPTDPSPRGGGWRTVRSDLPPIGWGYGIWFYEPPEDGDYYGPDHWQNGGDRDGDLVWKGNNGEKIYPTHDEAKAAAEAHYYSLDHHNRSAPSSGHDSGVDYESLINPKREPDDDYGDIFGKESMRRTAVAPEDVNCSICGGPADIGHFDQPRGSNLVAFSCEDHAPLVEHVRERDGQYAGHLLPHIVAAMRKAYERLIVEKQEQITKGWDPDKDLDPNDPRIKGAARLLATEKGTNVNDMRTAAIDFLAGQNTGDRGELLFRAHRHASDRTGQLPVPVAQRVVRSFVAAVNREIAAAPARRPRTASRTAATMPDFPDELMF